MELLDKEGLLSSTNTDDSINIGYILNCNTIRNDIEGELFIICIIILYYICIQY